jgi:hypothetical protein
MGMHLALEDEVAPPARRDHPMMAHDFLIGGVILSSSCRNC